MCKNLNFYVYNKLKLIMYVVMYNDDVLLIIFYYYIFFYFLMFEIECDGFRVRVLVLQSKQINRTTPVPKIKNSSQDLLTIDPRFFSDPKGCRLRVSNFQFLRIDHPSQFSCVYQQTSFPYLLLALRSTVLRTFARRVSITHHLFFVNPHIFLFLSLAKRYLQTADTPTTRYTIIIVRQR